MRLDGPTLLRGLLLLVIAGWAFAIAYGVGLATDTASGAPVQPAEQRQPAPGREDALERRRDAPQTTVDEVGATVMCPSCDTTVDQSQAPSALRIRAYIEEAVAAGWTEEEIQDGLVAEYDGDESILAVPRTEGLGMVAWIVPGVIALLAAIGGLALVRQWRGAREDGQPRTAAPYSQSSSTSSSSPSSSPESPPDQGTTVPDPGEDPAPPSPSAR